MYFRRSSGVFLTSTIGKPLSEVHIDASFGYFSQSTQSESIHWTLTHYKQTPDMTWAATADLIIPATLAATIAISLAIALVTPGFSKESWKFDGFLISWYTPDLITCWSLWFHNWNSASWSQNCLHLWKWTLHHQSKLEQYMMHKKTVIKEHWMTQTRHLFASSLQENKQLLNSFASSGILSSNPPHFWLSFFTETLTIITPVVTPVIMPALAASFTFSIFATLTTAFASSFAAVFATSLHCKDTMRTPNPEILGWNDGSNKVVTGLQLPATPMAVWLTS